MPRHAYRANVPLTRAGGLNRIRTKSVPLNRPNGSGGIEAPEIYMWAGSGSSLFISADLRDFGLEDPRIRVQGTRLIFEGTLRPESPTGNGGIQRAKKSSTTFIHALDLPYEVNDDEAEVQNQNGLISIVLQRKESGQQDDRAPQSSLKASMQRFFGVSGESSRSLKDEITMLETFERYLAFQSVKGSAR
ncbi:MAG: Hsp20/alpha crystallin family protein [Syntrophaceae bacterium PtaU1.Bin231]|nr:MAG: Hsp20/alpha crystallin family protein [Syntrophaceae bacterium PtaU1.Bin231]